MGWRELLAWQKAWLRQVKGRTPDVGEYGDDRQWFDEQHQRAAQDRRGY